MCVHVRKSRIHGHGGMNWRRCGRSGLAAEKMRVMAYGRNERQRRKREKNDRMWANLNENRGGALNVNGHLEVEVIQESGTTRAGWGTRKGEQRDQ